MSAVVPLGFLDYSKPNQKTVHFSEHEVHFSFVNDKGAELFERWWAESGHEQFRQWADELSAEEFE